MNWILLYSMISIASFMIPMNVLGSHYQDCLIRNLENKIEEFGEGVLTTEDREKIGKLFVEGELPSVKTAHKAFEIYLEARLRVLPEEQANTVRKFFRQRTTVQVVEDESMLLERGSHDPYSGMTTILSSLKFPYHLDTYQAMAHEIAGHAVESVSVRLKLGVKKKRHIEYVLGSAKQDLIRFLAEKHAMSAEWEFLNSIPESVKETMLRSLRSVESSEMTEHRRDVIRWVENSKLSLENYLKAEYEAGRYSMEQIRKIRIRERRFFFGLVAATGVVFSAASTLTYCRSLLQSDDYETSLFYQAICKHFHEK